MNDKSLDEILEDALASYTLHEPRAGFNVRTMARIRDEETAPRWTWPRFAMAAFALTILAATIAMWQTQPSPPVPIPAAQHVPDVPVVRTAEHPRVVHRGSLTPEVKALLAFAQQAPEAALELAQPDRPLKIEAIDIRPLQIDDIEIGEIK